MIGTIDIREKACSWSEPFASRETAAVEIRNNDASAFDATKVYVLAISDGATPLATSEDDNATALALSDSNKLLSGTVYLNTTELITDRLDSSLQDFETYTLELVTKDQAATLVTQPQAVWKTDYFFGAEDPTGLTGGSFNDLTAIDAIADGDTIAIYDLSTTSYLKATFTQVWTWTLTKLAALLTTKGDLLVRNASTVTRLAVGANDLQLTADSAQATGMKWAAAGVSAHALGGGSHTADTLSNLNSKVSDATLIDTADSRLSDARDPTAHAAEHTDGTDDIQDATNAQKGVATAAQITALEANTAASHAQSHSVASHNDTTATGTELNTLTGAGNADSLHAHAHSALSSLTWATAGHTIAANVPLYIGATASYIKYDTANLLINPRASGSGDVVIEAGGLGIGTAPDQSFWPFYIEGATFEGGGAKTTNGDAYSRWQARNDADTYGELVTYGSTITGNLFGSAKANRSYILTAGASSTGLGVGTFTNDPLTLGTNDTARMVFGGAGAIAFPTLTSNGFLKTTGGTGTLAIDTATYLTSVSGGDHSTLANLNWAAAGHTVDAHFASTSDSAYTCGTISPLARWSVGYFDRISVEDGAADSNTNAKVYGGSTTAGGEAVVGASTGAGGYGVTGTNINAGYGGYFFGALTDISLVTATIDTSGVGTMIFTLPTADGSAFDTIVTDGSKTLTFDTIDYAFVTARDGATDVTAAELEILTDGSTTALHVHAGGGQTSNTIVNVDSSMTRAQIQALIDAEPILQNGYDLTFQAAAGTYTMDGRLNFNHFQGGNLFVYGVAGDSDALNTAQSAYFNFASGSQDGFKFYDCSSFVQVKKFKINIADQASQACIKFSTCPGSGDVRACYLLAAGKTVGNNSCVSATTAAYVYVTTTNVSNVGYGLSAATARMVSDGNDDTGTAPDYGIYSLNTSVVGKVGTQPSGTVADELTSAAGRFPDGIEQYAGELHLTASNKRTYWGASDEVSMWSDGTDGHVDPSGVLQIHGAPTPDSLRGQDIGTTALRWSTGFLSRLNLTNGTLADDANTLITGTLTLAAATAPQGLLLGVGYTGAGAGLQTNGLNISASTTSGGSSVVRGGVFAANGTGVAQVSYGLLGTATGATQNYGFSGVASGAYTLNVGALVQATGATTNIGLQATGTQADVNCLNATIQFGNGGVILTYPTADGTADQTQVTNGSGTMSWKTAYVAGGTDVAVADGGSGRGTALAYGVICGGTTATAAHQSIASVGTATHVLTSNGAGALPTFQVIPAAGFSAYTELMTIITAGADASWTAVDVSASAAVGDVLDILLENTAAGAELTVGVRTFGSALNRYTDLHEAEGGGVTSVTMRVTVGDDTGTASIEVYEESDSDVVVTIIGKLT